MIRRLSRRELLRISSLGAAAASLELTPWRPPEEMNSYIGVGRVTTHSIYVYAEPNLKSEKVATKVKDVLLMLKDEVNSPFGPSYNPRWYRLLEGWVHSSYVQRVEKSYTNPPLTSVLSGGQLGEITVPLTQALRKTRTMGWLTVYRLYFGSVHWITGVDVGPDGSPWAFLTDELLHVDYAIPSVHIRPIPWEELNPLSPQVPMEKKRIEVSLGDQTLTAYEYDQVVLHTKISSGLQDRFVEDGELPTDTPAGTFHMQLKMPSKHMGDGKLTDDIHAYELPGVPWVSFFISTGFACHGTYWHDNFGRKMSHGCVNMPNPKAKWLYRWCTPVIDAGEWYQKGWGTVVKVFE